MRLWGIDCWCRVSPLWSIVSAATHGLILKPSVTSWATEGLGRCCHFSREKFNLFAFLNTWSLCDCPWFICGSYFEEVWLCSLISKSKLPALLKRFFRWHHQSHISNWIVMLKVRGFPISHLRNGVKRRCECVWKSQVFLFTKTTGEQKPKIFCGVVELEAFILSAPEIFWHSIASHSC